jgi:hypothetical protein
MKHLIVLLFIVPLLTGCPKDKQKDRTDTAKAFRDNGYNFPEYTKLVYKNIRLQIPKSFEFDYGSGYCYKASAMNRRDFGLGVIFTVERFDEDDLESELMEDYMIEDDLLNGFHDAYVYRRFESLYNGSISFKKEVRKTIKFEGVIQTVSGKYSEYTEQELYYVTSTLKVDDEYYVFQIITPKEMMNYVYDDFEHILETVRKK